MSNAVGSIGSGAAAAIAAYLLAQFGTTDPKLIAEITAGAGVIGSGLGGIGGAFLNDHLPGMRMFDRRYWVLKALLRRKLISDFKYSFLNRPADLYESIGESSRILDAAKLISDSRDSYPDVPLVILSERLSARARFDFEHTLERARHIKVNCAAMFPAALAVLLSLKARLHDIVDLDIDHSDINSHEQFSRASHGDRFDFIWAAEGPFFLAISGNAGGTIDPKGLRRYTRIIPCNIEWQDVFVRKGSRRPMRAYVYQTSSAELQFRAGLTGASHLEEEKIYRGTDIPGLAEKGRLTSGDCVIAWEPLAYLFERSGLFDRVRGGRFKVWISLFCCEEWSSPMRRKRLEAFRQLFIDEWKALNLELGHKTALKLILDSDRIIESFALSSGIKQYPGFGQAQ